MAVKENFRNFVGRAGTVGAPKPSVLILGNGPSLAEDLPRLIERREHETKDVMAVNFLRWTSVSETVRPAYYVLSDPMFFRDSACRDRVAELYRVLDEKVTWPMNLYVQYYNPERFDTAPRCPIPISASCASIRSSTAGSAAWSFGCSAAASERQLRDRGAGVRIRRPAPGV